MSQLSLLQQMAKILLPSIYLEDFEATSIKEQPEEWLIVLTEKPERAPAALQGNDVALDGYCTTVDVLPHAFSLKKIYRRFRRGRWKERASTVHHQNPYNLHLAGAKITPTLGAFLKEAFG
ncbi:MAG TPA: hypothetical protein ENN24_06885 [Bacteroidetes bacterium]|nr:hypothetical protein [Bacteroidota bacterium]